jgi:hypothetical protein
MPMNLLIQLTTLILAIITSYIISKLAAEELKQYNKVITKVAKISYIATFIVPIIFVENIITPIFVAASYGVIAFPKKNETQMFYMLVPLTLFLATQNTIAFLLTLCCFFTATLFTTTIVLTPFVKKEELCWNNKILKVCIRQYRTYLAITVILYIIMWFLK